MDDDRNQVRIPDDTVLPFIEQAKRRDAEDERKRDQAAYDAEFAELIRPQLLDRLDQPLLELLEQRPIDQTLIRYDGDIRRYIKWCGDKGITPFSSPEADACYLLCELEDGKSYQAIKTAHAAISWARRIKNLPDPSPATEDADPGPRPFAAAAVRYARRLWLADHQEDEHGGLPPD